MLARIEFYQRLVDSGLPADFVQTIHDSLVVDTPAELCYTISSMLKESIEMVPELCKREFDYNFKLPIWCEIQTGQNKKDLTEFNFN